MTNYVVRILMPDGNRLLDGPIDLYLNSIPKKPIRGCR